MATPVTALLLLGGRWQYAKTWLCLVKIAKFLLHTAKAACDHCKNIQTAVLSTRLTRHNAIEQDSQLVTRF